MKVSSWHLTTNQSPVNNPERHTTPHTDSLESVMSCGSHTPLNKCLTAKKNRKKIPHARSTTTTTYCCMRRGASASSEPGGKGGFGACRNGTEWTASAGAACNRNNRCVPLELAAWLGLAWLPAVDITHARHDEACMLCAVVREGFSCRF